MFGNSKKGSASGTSLSSLVPKFDVVGPTVDDDIRRAIFRYGAEAVQQAIKSQTKAKIGRKPEKDWPELREFIERDAREWLEGSEPLKNRKNYAIASEFARRNPGHSAVATHQRIERKLKKKPYDRLWYMLVSAYHLSCESYSFKDHIRALEALADLPTENGGQAGWMRLLQTALSDVDDYRAKEGSYPSDELTMKQVEEVARNALIRQQPTKGSSLGSLLAAYAPVELKKD